jgi:menaquinol-cytochrome c reductase iron-sulfur subunit
MKIKDNVSRRDVMKLGILLINGFIGTALGIPAIAYVIYPAMKSDESQNWIRLGSLSKIEIGMPTLFKPKVQRKNGWIVDEEKLGVFVLTEDGQNYIAMSNICTHLGCRVRWIQENEQFLSPCHNGVFDKLGYVVSGPPPRPLDVFKTKVENGEILIQIPVNQRSA